MLPLLATSLIAFTVPAADRPCPRGVIDQIDGLYQWHVKPVDGNEDPDKAFSSQRQRFTPSLFKLLLEARQLTPVRDGRFIDFDVFSNTQVSTYGAKVSGCSAKNNNSIQAEVAVDVGLRGQSSGTPRRLLYKLNNSQSSWRINNITYLDGEVFELRRYLQKLIQPTP